MRIIPFDYAVRNLGRAPGRLVAMVAGIGLVVLLVVASAAFAQGMRRSLRMAPSNANILLLGAGSEESIERSQVDAAAPGHIIASIRGIRESLGVAFVSPEIHMGLVVQRSRDKDEELRTLFRGVTSTAYPVHPQVEITDGRAPRSGYDEIMVGRHAASQLSVPDSDLAVGRTIWFDERDWSIVGRFRAPGTVMDAEVWIPLSDLQIAAKRSTLSCVVVTLDGAEFADVEAWAMTRLDLELAAVLETDYYASLQRFYRPLRMMVWGTAGLMALAGLLGGLNTQHAAFANRAREVGMLRSLGFSRRAIMLSLLQESLLVASAGALVACGLSWALLDGVAVRFSMGVFLLAVDQSVLAIGLAAGMIVGLIGTIPPAYQCFRQPIPSALKAT